MKKSWLHIPSIPILCMITLVFAAFTLGFYLGRNQHSGVLLVSVPTQCLTQPTEDSSPTSVTQETEPSVSFPININRASAEDLTALPGIGDVLAKRIVQYRNDHGKYLSVEELINVEGIGQTRLTSLLDYITTGG